MSGTGWSLTWSAPITLALTRDHTDEHGVWLRQGASDIVEIG